MGDVIKVSFGAPKNTPWREIMGVPPNTLPRFDPAAYLAEHYAARDAYRMEVFAQFLAERKPVEILVIGVDADDNLDVLTSIATDEKQIEVLSDALWGLTQ